MSTAFFPHWADSLPQILRQRARQSAAAVAFRFVDGDGQAEQVTYAELDRRAHAVAASLVAATGGRTEPALLLYTPGIDYLVGLIGCFYAGLPAVPAFPPGTTRLPRTMSRLFSIIEDAGVRLVLTTAENAPVVAEWFPATVAGRAPQVIATDVLDSVDGGPPPEIAPGTLALVQYTSGSTSLPRGVMLTHGQIVANCAEITRGFGIHAASSGVFWLPPYHDMGLIGGILTPLAVGTPVTFMSPVSFLRRPVSWLRTVSRYRATITGAPNFAYDLCVRRATDDDIDELDLTSVELTFTGAEPVRRDTIERFVERFAPCGFRAESIHPCYGLAEATLYVTGSKPLGGWRSVSVARDALELDGVARLARPGEPARDLVSCGTPGPDTELLIVDPVRHDPVGGGAVGEIWISSPSVANGYWGRPDESSDAFGAKTTTGEGPFLRTGDLGFVLDSELFVTGRMKDLIVIKGHNYHPVDIEQVCDAGVTGIRSNCGAAFGVEDDERSEEQLVVVYESAPRMSEEQHRETLEAIRRVVSKEVNLAPHTIVLIAPRTIPKTSSGKVQRWLCRRQYLAGDLKEVARWQAAPAPGDAVGAARL